MAYTRIKICGITRPEDAALAAELGADAIGLNFYRGPRRITTAQADTILQAIPTMVTPVALVAIGMANCPDAPSIHEIRGEFTRRAIYTFQCYGEVPAELVEQCTDVHCWMVHAVESRESIQDVVVQTYLKTIVPAAILLDTVVGGQLGGTGKTFNWHWIAEARAAGELEGLPPIILAGGLHPGNVAEAIRIARPYAVDVSSGVEVPGRPGIKDAAKLRDFIQAVRGCS